MQERKKNIVFFTGRNFSVSEKVGDFFNSYIYGDMLLRVEKELNK